MKLILTATFVVLTTLSFGQQIKFKIAGQKDTTVNLVRYFGKGLYYADTAEMKDGVAIFDGSKEKSGILALYLPGQQMLEFIFNGEEIYIETALPNLMKSAKIKKSDENKIFSGYISFIASKKERSIKLVEERKAIEKDSEEYNSITKKINEANDEVLSYQKNIIKDNPEMLVSKIIKMSMDIVIPDSPTNEAGEIIDSSFRFNYYREHFFDNIDLTDDRLVRTPIYHNKLNTYFSKQMMVQHWDTVLHYAFKLCDQLLLGSEMYQYNVSWITSQYEQSKIMGMDKVFVMMGDRYYRGNDSKGDPKAFWMKKESLDKLVDKVDVNMNLVIGSKPVNISLLDTTDQKWYDFYSLDAEYTILYFWDPQCGHCKKITPKLQTLYEEKFKARNIEIFAIGKAVGEDFENWKKFISDNNLEFINVAVTDRLYTEAMKDARQFVPKYTSIESLNYQKTYDVFTSPKVFILDKDKTIIAKSLSISQLENLMDRLQDKADLPKLFPPDLENPEDEQMH